MPDTADTGGTYVSPELYDYGSIVELTKGTAFRGYEDGGTKVEPLPHHSIPTGGGGS